VFPNLHLVLIRSDFGKEGRTGALRAIAAAILIFSNLSACAAILIFTKRRGIAFPAISSFTVQKNAFSAHSGGKVSLTI
jgi:hypothetical protein